MDVGLMVLCKERKMLEILRWVNMTGRFELVDTESGADIEAVFGSIVYDSSDGQVLVEDLIIDRQHFCRGMP
jgi:hypothetical protein